MQIKQIFLLLVHKSSVVNFIVFPPRHLCSGSILHRHSQHGVTFDNVTFRQHISQTCRCCFYHISDLRRIRRYMYFATALVSSRLDYCNSLYHNIDLKDILKLQHVQNCLARVVTRSPRFSHSVPLLKSLHWSPVQYHIIF